jgi:hypothetical protein
VNIPAATPAETTGEIVLSWAPDGPVVTAPDRAAVPAVELFGMRRVPATPGRWSSRAASATASAPRISGGGALCICIACRSEQWSPTARD